MTAAEDVKQKLDIVDVIGQYVTLTKAGKNFRGLCPFHSEKHPSFFVYPEQQSWHCFGACSTGGDIFAFVMKKQGVGFGEALRILAEKAGVNIDVRRENEAGKQERDRLHQANEAATKYFHELLIKSPAAEKARGYLAGRGLTAQSMIDFQLGYSLNSWDALKLYLTERGYTESELLKAGLLTQAEDGTSHDRFRNKIMFPICDIKGRVTGFGSRVLDDSQPKYINSPQTPVFDKSGSLYGINRAHDAISEHDLTVIVEGYMDVITAHQYGFTNVVAPMGTSITDKQIATLKKLSKNLTLALDSDSAGEEAMLKGINYENMLGAEVKVMVLPAGKDPDEVIKEDKALWERLLQEAVPVVDYTFQMTISRLDLSKDEQQLQAVNKLLPIVLETRDPIRKGERLLKLSKLTRVNIDSLKTALNQLAAKDKGRYHEDKSTKVNRILRPVLSSPPEEHCLALLLQHPELKSGGESLLPEYFENSENREIFLAYQKTEDVQLIRENLDPEIWEHLGSLLTRNLLPGSPELKIADCILRLRQEYLRSLEAKKEAVLAQEVESKGKSADIARLKEEGIDSSAQLKEVFYQRRRGRGNGGKNENG